MNDNKHIYNQDGEKISIKLNPDNLRDVVDNSELPPIVKNQIIVLIREEILRMKKDGLI